ncbi:MAG TPA: MmgE/PrpD family protein [Pseudoduganella sp.]
MTTSSILQRLAEYSAGIDANDVPASALQRVDWVVMDLVASTFAALGSPASRKLWAYAQDANPEAAACTLWGSAQKASAATAAMVNGANGYEAEYDDGNTLGGHWGSSCIPSILAIAECTSGRTSGEVIASIIAAYDVGDRVSRPFSRTLLERGVHFPGMMGVFGAVAGASRMLRLSPAQTTRALALSSLAPVAPYHPGLTGSDSKSMYSGWPNFCGIHFTRLAEAGFGGAPDLLEGPQGLAHVWGWEGDAASLAHQVLDGLGSRFAIERTYFKPYPCCRWLHPVIQGVSEMVSVNAIDVKDIARIQVSGPRFLDMYMVRGPFLTGTQAKYSLPYCAAAASSTTEVGQQCFEDARLQDSLLAALSEAVEFTVDEDLDRSFPGSYSVNVAIVTRSGRLLASHQFPRWSAERPPSFDELATKFACVMREKCAGGIAEQWVDYFQRGLRADASMNGFFGLMRASVLRS